MQTLCSGYAVEASWCIPLIQRQSAMNTTANTTTAVLPEWLYYEQIVYSGIIGLIGIPGNILIILVFAHSRDRITTDYMVFSMAISDLLGSLVCATVNILQHIQVVWVQIGTTWITRTNNYFNTLTAIISMWLLSLTAIDRYMKTCRPHSVFFTIPKARWTCVIIWAVVPLITSPTLFAAHVGLRTESNRRVFEEKWAIAAFIVAASCSVSLLITAVAYMLVAFALCKRLKIKMEKRRATKLPNATGNILCQATLVSGKHDDFKNNAFGGNIRDQLDCVPVYVPIDVNQVYVTEKAQNGCRSYVDEMTKAGLPMHKISGVDKVLRNEQKRVNRTTIMMFLITSINTFTFILIFIGQKLKKSNEAPVIAIGYITRTSYMVNYIANPLLYISMSSKFREGVRKLFRRR